MTIQFAEGSFLKIIGGSDLELKGTKLMGTCGNMWNGVEATDGEFNGLLTQFASDTSIIDAGNGFTAIGEVTDENTVQANLKIALGAVPVAMRGKDLVVAVSPDIMQHYMFKMISLGQANDGTSGERVAQFGRYKLTEVAGLPDNTIICYEKKNIVLL